MYIDITQIDNACIDINKQPDLNDRAAPNSDSVVRSTENAIEKSWRFPLKRCLFDEFASCFTKSGDEILIQL